MLTYELCRIIIMISFREIELINIINNHHFNKFNIHYLHVRELKEAWAAEVREVY